MSAYMIMDGMWGSCGKGLLAGKLAMERNPDVIINNFGPNAGHTFIGPDNEVIMTSQLPSGLVSKDSILILGADSIINPDLLLAEVDKYEAEYNIKARLLIHPRAAVVTQHDIDVESGTMGHIGSTKKGVGNAVSRKVLRGGVPTIPAVACQEDRLADYVAPPGTIEGLLRTNLTYGSVQVESAQGLELSINHGSHYPQCTSRDITPAAIMNGVGIPMRYLDETNVVVRTYPIRVGHEYDEFGAKVGDSGDVYPGMRELTWEEMSKLVGIDIQERTTVTKKVRRVFSWSWQQYRNMLWQCGPCNVMINFMNYLDAQAPSLAEANNDTQAFFKKAQYEAVESGGHIDWLGWGPAMNQVEDVV